MLKMGAFIRILVKTREHFSVTSFSQHGSSVMSRISKEACGALNGSFVSPPPAPLKKWFEGPTEGGS